MAAMWDLPLADLKMAVTDVLDGMKEKPSDNPVILVRISPATVFEVTRKIEPSTNPALEKLFADAKACQRRNYRHFQVPSNVVLYLCSLATGAKGSK